MAMRGGSILVDCKMSRGFFLYGSFFCFKPNENMLLIFLFSSRMTNIRVVFVFEQVDINVYKLDYYSFIVSIY